MQEHDVGAEARDGEGRRDDLQLDQDEVQFRRWRWRQTRGEAACVGDEHRSKPGPAARISRVGPGRSGAHPAMSNPVRYGHVKAGSGQRKPG